jgi:transposase
MKKGFNRRGLYRMKQFYETYTGNPKVSPLVTQIQWSNHLIILSGTKTIEEKEFYPQACSFYRMERLIYDKAADSDELRERLKRRGIELIAPHRSNRRKKKTQDGRPLRRYKRRWKMERTISWIGNYRKLVVRYDRHIHIYQAFFNIACMLVTLNKLVS